MVNLAVCSVAVNGNWRIRQVTLLFKSYTIVPVGVINNKQNDLCGTATSMMWAQTTTNMTILLLVYF